MLESLARLLQLAAMTAVAIALALTAPSAARAQVVALYPFDAAAEVGDWKVISPAFSSMSWEPSEDASGNSASGALLLENSSTVASGSAQFQLCLDSVSPGQSFRVSLAAKIPTGQLVSGRVDLVVTPTSELDCFGGGFTPLGGTSIVSTSGTWMSGSLDTTAVPDGAQSVYVRVFVVKTESAGTLEALVDDVLVGRADIFADGFESGDLLAWN